MCEIVIKDMDVHEHVRLSNIILRYKLKVKEQLVVRKDMDVNQHGYMFLLLLRLHSYSRVFNNEH
jgi:hypothetical protein